jgi:hypothetical protein
MEKTIRKQELLKAEVLIATAQQFSPRANFAAQQFSPRANFRQERKRFIIVVVIVIIIIIIIINLLVRALLLSVLYCKLTSGIYDAL